MANQVGEMKSAIDAVEAVATAEVRKVDTNPTPAIDLVVVRGKDPVGVNDMVTKGFLDGVANLVLTMTGSTPGAGQNESVELLGPGGKQLTLGDFTANTPVHIEVDAEGSGVVQGSNAKITRAMTIDQGSAWASNTTITLDSPGALTGHGTAATALWTLTLSHDVSPERIKLVFATGAGNQHAVSVKARVYFGVGSAFPPNPA